MKKRGSVRIIAGKWRGRRLKVPMRDGLRPTTSRAREMVFNWLSPYIEGAHCLDLFAGSGALGLEALSRGAASVEMVDKSHQIVDMLQRTLQQLGAIQAKAYRACLPQGLRTPPRPYDIVFIDPPYQSLLLAPCSHYLEEQGCLARAALIYLEAGGPLRPDALPENWKLIKIKPVGQSYCHLAKREHKCKMVK